MGFRTSLLVLVIGLAALASPQGTVPQTDIGTLKKGVVRIKNTKFGDVGAGFIVRVNDFQAYIVTAAHVVRGDEHSEVYMFTRQKEPLRATLIDREDDDQKGLALLWVKADKPTLAGLTALSLGSSFELQGGEEVRFIGFPEGTPIWTTTAGNVARVEGRNLVLSGTIRDGNSGGPVLLNGRVVGLVTDLGPSLGYAVQAESVALYVRGVEPELGDITTTTVENSTDKATSNAEFCKALTTLAASSKNRFESIKGERNVDHFHSLLVVPGTLKGYIRGNEEAYYYVLIDEDKQKVETEYNKVVSKLKHCLLSWKQKDERGEYRKYDKFRENTKGTVISVHHTLQPQNNGKYYLSLSVYPPGNTEW